ncbi:MAG: hypothetical protein LBQ39_08365 [Tannerellaceae bacterium]|jgi:hypothetical protein|nr:hypothetical protein [Tannerellaceae bacterium]
MKDKSDVFERFRNSFDHIDGHYHILERCVPLELQMEYFKCSERMRKGKTKMTDDKYDFYKRTLSDEETTAEHKRHALSALALSNEIRAYRVLEDYVQHADPEVTNWAYMALLESRISLESELLQEKQVYISTGLGGKGEKLRFYTLILASAYVPFQDYQRRAIERELAFFLSKGDCEIERLSIEDVYVELLFLAPLRADLKAIVENVIFECNQYGNFLSDMYSITNVKELSAEEIAKIIHDKYGNHKTGH